MMEFLRTLWQDPLYRLIVQVSLVNLLAIWCVVVAVLIIRVLRNREKRLAQRAFNEMGEPLMKYVDGELSQKRITRMLKELPRRYVIALIDRYLRALTGDSFERLVDLMRHMRLPEKAYRDAQSLFWWRRLDAIRILAAVTHPRARRLLLDLVNDRHEAVRLAAARALGRRGEEAAIPLLLEAIVEGQRLSTRQVANVLVDLGSSAHPHLRRALDQTPRNERQVMLHGTILQVLAVSHDHSAAPYIREALRSEHMELRVSAYKSAVLMHLDLSPEEIRLGLSDDAWPVRAQAAVIAGKSGDLTLARTLGEGLEDSAWWVRLNSAEALLKIGDEGVAELERIALVSEDNYARDMARRVLSEQASQEGIARALDELAMGTGGYEAAEDETEVAFDYGAEDETEVSFDYGAEDETEVSFEYGDDESEVTFEYTGDTVETDAVYEDDEMEVSFEQPSPVEGVAAFGDESSTVDTAAISRSSGTRPMGIDAGDGGATAPWDVEATDRDVEFVYEPAEEKS